MAGAAVAMQVAQSFHAQAQWVILLEDKPSNLLTAQVFGPYATHDDAKAQAIQLFTSKKAPGKWWAIRQINAVTICTECNQRIELHVCN